MPKNKAKTKIILGIDPGFAITGYALLKKYNNQIEVLTYGVIRTDSKDEYINRLKILYNELTKIIKKYQPEVMAIEKLFFAKNTKTAIQVGQARGVILLTGAINKLELTEYTPLQIKQAATTYGRANKNQIQKMMQLILKLREIPQPDDAADALAVAWFCSQDY